LIAVDSNILIYAHRTDSPFHEAAARKLSGLAEGAASWALPWPCLHEFLAITTNRRIYDPPATIDEATGFVDALLASPRVELLAESDTHWNALRLMMRNAGVVGGRVHDARIAAICLQHGVRELWSADRDFGRFPALKVVNPLLA
jgi:toxin-antitoxin system PIN domain toxin